jgi:acetyl esterase/lipase
MKTKSIFYILLLLFIASCTKNEDGINNNPTGNPSTNPIPLTESTLLNVSYGTNPQQVFDLYLPANRSESSTKTLILVHGGGWTSGDKADMAYLIPFLKQNLPGYAIANINYRLATTGVYAFPMQLDDMNAVFTKLKNDNNGISDNFGYIGTSAGAHLSMLYSYTNNPNNNIKMVASIVGPANFTDQNYTNNPAWISLYLSLTGVDYATNVPYYQNLSPFHKATSVSPPTLLLYGNADSLIPTTQGTDLHNKLDQLGVYNEFTLYNGGHGNWSQLDLLDSATKIVNFVRLKF